MLTRDEQFQAYPPDDSLGKVVIHAYREMLNYLFLSTLAVVAILIILIFFPSAISVLSGSGSLFRPSVFLLVAIAGALGAFFSALLRLYELKNLPAALYQNGLAFRGLSLFIYTLTPALIGCIAASILYLVFQAGLLQDGLFPAIACTPADGKCPGLGALLDGYGPKAPADYAKAILWGFVAGFAERLVPDLLDNFAQSDALKGSSSNRGDSSPVTEQDNKNPGPTTPTVVSQNAPNIASRAAANGE
jgi:hypothetical protein